MSANFNNSFSCRTTETGRWPPVYLGQNTVLCHVLGYKMFLDTRDIGIVPHLCTSGIWETHVETVFRRTIKSGWRVMDVGANFGYYSILLGSLIGPQGSGLIVEAIPEIYSLLSSTIEVNGFRKQFQVVNYAAFDRKSTLTFQVRASRKLNSNFVKTVFNSSNNANIQVSAMTIDAMVAELWNDGIVNFIKIDIEGAEARAWIGMQETLRKNKKSIVIIMEVNTQRLMSMNEDALKFFDNIESWFPKIRRITNAGTLELITVKELKEETGAEDHMLFLSNNPKF